MSNPKECLYSLRIMECEYKKNKAENCLRFEVSTPMAKAYHEWCEEQAKDVFGKEKK